jgi:shikimate kinase
LTARHLVLVGLPGAGKSTVGRAAAKRLGRPFIDLDQSIERTVGATVAEIFSTRGEAAFRALERAATATLVGAPASVVAPGGGWITVPDTVAMLRPTAHTIYLKAAPETAFRRLGGGVHRRPLLQADADGPQSAVARLYDARHTAYEAADFVVDTEHLSLQQVTDAVVELAGRLADY